MIKSGDTLTKTEWVLYQQKYPNENFHKITKPIWRLLKGDTTAHPDYEGKWVCYDKNYGKVLPTTLGETALISDGAGCYISDSRYCWWVKVHGDEE